MSKSILLLSGINLEQLGKRDPAIYGTETLEDLVDSARKAAQGKGYELDHLQSGSERELVAAIHAARDKYSAIVINSGAFTHYAWSMHDALQMFKGPVVELHISQVASREPWRHTSVIAPVATALIAGLGAYGYTVAVDAAIHLIEKNS